MSDIDVEYAKSVIVPWMSSVPALKDAELLVTEPGNSGGIKAVFNKNDTQLALAMFSLSQLNGCCGVCVSYHCWVHASLRGQGLGKALNKLRMILAARAGYTGMLCTDVTSNLPQRKILAKNGWKAIYRFINRRTGNDVEISVVDLLNES